MTVNVVAGQLAAALADGLRDRDVGVVIATVGGCQPTDVALTYQNASYLNTHRNCVTEAPAKQREMTARYHPKVVVWSDIMEWSAIQAEDGRTVTAGTPEWRVRVMAGWDRVLARVGTARLALVLPTWWAGWPAATPRWFTVEQQRSLFRAWAERHTAQVTVVDPAPALCPSGPAA